MKGSAKVLTIYNLHTMEFERCFSSKSPARHSSPVRRICFDRRLVVAGNPRKASTDVNARQNVEDPKRAGKGRKGPNAQPANI